MSAKRTMMTEYTCERLAGVAIERLADLSITAEFPKGDTPRSSFTATFRHECTNYDELLQDLPGVSSIEYFESGTDEPSEDWLACTCADYGQGDDYCFNKEMAHETLKRAANALSRGTDGEEA